MAMPVRDAEDRLPPLIEAATAAALCELRRKLRKAQLPWQAGKRCEFILGYLETVIAACWEGLPGTEVLGPNGGDGLLIEIVWYAIREAGDLKDAVKKVALAYREDLLAGWRARYRRLEALLAAAPKWRLPALDESRIREMVEQGAPGQTAAEQVAGLEAAAEGASQPAAEEPVGRGDEAGETRRRFPNRARWLRERMTAYRVSQVQLGTNSGLAVKTIRAILAGEPVAERSLAKLVRGLNAVPALRTVRRDHVPDD